MLDALPLDVLLAHVYPRVHELHMRLTLRAIRQIGPSRLENMPDLVCSAPERAGWSTRVQEAARHCPSLMSPYVEISE